MATMRTVPKAVAEIKAKDPCACLSASTLRRWVKEGKLHSVKVGKNYLVSMEAVEEFLSGAQG